MTRLIERIASTINAYHNCFRTGNKEWAIRHKETLDGYEKMLPSGSGFDNGTKIVVEDCSEKKIVLAFGYHHMDENGFYAGWTHHVATIIPAFIGGFDINIKTSEDTKEAKELWENVEDYVYDTLIYILGSK